MGEPNTSLRVFISYARRDCAAFAEELLAGLEATGFEPFLDRHDIAAGEDWEARLGGLIQSSDTVVFVISPASVSSGRCDWEVKKAESLSKRIIPVVAMDVPEEQTPTGLKRLNYIFFSQGHSFARGLGELKKALSTDLGWIREHTRLGELAARWRARGGPEEMLLRGSELEAAKAWLATWKAPAPEPTELHRDFIGESEADEEGRLGVERKRLSEMAAAQTAREEALKRLSRRTTMGLIGAGGLTAAAGGLAYWGVDAERRFREAQANSIETAIERVATQTDLAGQLAGYAAAPGQTAMDARPGNSPNSPFTSALLEQLADRSVSLQTGLARASELVYRETNGQRPYVTSDLNREVYLRRQSLTRQQKALVISIDSIAGGPPLPNAQRDAVSWELFLRECGFEVVRLSNPSMRDFTQSLTNVVNFPQQRRSEFHRRDGVLQAGIERRGPMPPPADTLAVLVYAGFGTAVQNQALLPSADISERSAEGFLRSSVALSSIQEQLRLGAAASVLILDTEFTDVDHPPPPPAQWSR